MRRRIVLSLILLFALFATGAIVASWYVTGATEQLRRLVDLHEVEGLRRNLVISVQAALADLYTTNTPMARTLDGIVANVEDLDSAADECTSCHHRPEIEPIGQVILIEGICHIVSLIPSRASSRGESGAQDKTRTSTSRRKLAPEDALRATHLTMLKRVRITASPYT